MSKIRFTLNIVAVLASSLAFASLAQAQNTRSWVAGDGDDANPCSIASPCKTYVGAIAKTLPGGEINTLRPGNFGPLNAVTTPITKSITIDGGGAGMSGITAVGGNDGIDIAAGAIDVITIRNVTINGQANNPLIPTAGKFGINLTSGGALIVENVVIEDMGDTCINFVPTNLSAGSPPGQAGPLRLYVSDSSLTNSSGGIGVNIQPAPGASPANGLVVNCDLHNNVIGVVVGGAGNAATVVNSTASGRVGNFGAVPSNQNNFGFMVQSGGRLNLETCTATNLITGIRAVEGTITISNCNVFNNGIGLEVGGPLANIVSYGNNRVSGNTTNVVGALTFVAQT